MVVSRLGLGLAMTLLLLPNRECGEGKSPGGATVPVSAVSAAAPVAAPVPSSEPVADAFAASVRPVLLNRCAPCHEPGGQMYERLPFDDRKVIAAHPEGILKRLKDADREAVEKWLASLPEKSSTQVPGASSP